jgi:hypothetical protein
MIDPSDGTELSSLAGGRYSIVGLLGSGAQGSTLLAVQEATGRHVAIKRFVVKGARSWKDVELAEREAAVLASLSHPRLPAYVEHFEEGGALYLVMERIEGVPLFGPGEARGGDLALPSRALARLGEAEVVRMIREVGEVLAYLHGRAPPVVHRDVKPGNVLRRPDGSFVLIDFGAVRDRLRPEGGSTVVGTFGFMAPEQFQGRAGPGSDVYSLGATALSLLTGREPEHLPHKGLALDVAAALGPGREPLVELLTAMLAPDPDARATAVAPLLARYDAALGGDAPRPSARAAGPEGPARSGAAEVPPRAPGAAPPDPVLGELEQTIEAGVKALEEGIESGARELQRFLSKTVAEAKAREAEERALSKGQRKLRRRDERRAREAARRERRAARAAGASTRPRPAPPLAAFFLLLAEIVVTVSVGVAVPLVLSLLAIVFGPGLRAASRKVEAANARAVAAIRRARLGDASAEGSRESSGLAAPEQGKLRARDAGDEHEVDPREREAEAEREAEREAEAEERALRDEARRTEERRRR